MAARPVVLPDGGITCVYLDCEVLTTLPGADVNLPPSYALPKRTDSWRVSQAFRYCWIFFIELKIVRHATEASTPSLVAVVPLSLIHI